MLGADAPMLGPTKPVTVTGLLGLLCSKDDDSQQVIARGWVIEVYDRRVRALSGQGLHCKTMPCCPAQGMFSAGSNSCADVQGRHP